MQSMSQMPANTITLIQPQASAQLYTRATEDLMLLLMSLPWPLFGPRQSDVGFLEEWAEEVWQVTLLSGQY